MSFTNLTPDTNPDGSRFQRGSFGIRYFYFTFVPTTVSLEVYLTRNIYRNEEFITRIFTPQSPNSRLIQNVSNVVPPCVFINGQITISTSSGLPYKNTSSIPDFKINNLIIGTTYILESRTIYNDPGMDFGAYIKLSLLKYIQTSTNPITPNLPIPLPVPSPPLPPPVPTTGLPPTPTGLVASNGMCGVSLSWNPVQASVQITQYLIYREGILLSSSSTPNYMDCQVINGNPYTYTVSCLNLVGESEQSVSRSITAMFSFTCLVPIRTPTGTMIMDSMTRYHYFLFTPITESIDVFCYNGTSSTRKAIIGLYDTTDPSTNIFVSSNLMNLDSNVSFGSKTLGNLTVDGLTVIPYTNTGTLNFTIKLPSLDTTLSSVILKTYILEIVSYTTDTFTPDFGVNFKSTSLTYNSVSLVRGLPSPYVISYDFTNTSESNYTNYIYPNLDVFQHVKTVLECILTTTHNARGANRNNDMLVHFTISDLIGDTLGESSLDEWKSDSEKIPQFTYEQSIMFNSKYFINGYMSTAAYFNGANTVNGMANINLFNVLLHEMIHGLGFFYTSSNNIGWNSFLTDLPNTPWYKGPVPSVALSCYKTYSKNQALQRIPVEENYGPGTALSHWDDGKSETLSVNNRLFNGVYHPAPSYEIMTGFLGNSEYMTGLTAGVLKDYGYSVNLTCPYVVSHPYSSLMPLPASRLKCMCVEYESKTVNRLVIQEMPPQKPVPAEIPTKSPKPETPSLIHYLQSIGYYIPVYFT
jgi:hypothetical protein